MIRCNLAVLLAERNLKISKVSTDTGISRTTLTSLANNYSQGIQFDTLNTLCLYLRVTPEQLISYVPIDIKVMPIKVWGVLDSSSNNLTEIEISITERGKVTSCDLCAEIYYSVEGGLIDNLEIHISLWDANGNEDIETMNEFLIKAFKRLSPPFILALEDIIYTEIEREFSTFMKFAYGFAYEFFWSDEFT